MSSADRHSEINYMYNCLNYLAFTLLALLNLCCSEAAVMEMIRTVLQFPKFDLVYMYAK